MHYLTAVLAVFIIGSPNFNNLGQGFTEDLFDELQSWVCEIFTDVLKVYRHKALKEGAAVELHTYTKGSDEDKNNDYDSIDFDANVTKITVIIHGYMGERDNDWIEDLREALFKREKHNMNVVVVDWFQSYNYYASAGAVNKVAKKISQALLKLNQQYVEHYTKTTKETPTNETRNKLRPYLHIMGHSLGAHIAGLTAKKLKSAYWKVDRVTAFDPAKPFFDVGGKFSKYRLNKSYARFVDVIHTNSQPKLSTFGLYDALGHVDFYVNGGDYQPQCEGDRGKQPKEQPKSLCNTTDVRECLTGLNKDVACLTSAHVIELTNMVCDHSQAQEYFTKSLNGIRYFGKKIDHSNESYKNCYDGQNCTADTNCAEMGIYANMLRQGSYYVNTTCGPKDEDSSESLGILDAFYEAAEDGVDLFLDDDDDDDEDEDEYEDED